MSVSVPNFSSLAGLEVTEKFVCGWCGVGWVPIGNYVQSQRELLLSCVELSWVELSYVVFWQQCRQVLLTSNWVGEVMLLFLASVSVQESWQSENHVLSQTYTTYWHKRGWRSGGQLATTLVDRYIHHSFFPPAPDMDDYLLLFLNKTWFVKISY